GRSMSRLLAGPSHGESRDRGQAMVDLVEPDRRDGFELEARELPDYLPLLREFLAHRPGSEAREWLHHIGHIAGMLAARAASIPAIWPMWCSHSRASLPGRWARNSRSSGR
ncbi:nitrate reductase molybdenum cofactor assembly chaperone, partial [Stenotrophomonas sp. MB339]|uniref:nitrate reductase molybdenum cofactor assembly chaperone n=1 Tax=Stenotrophomonas sp. MB339 TaxID=1663558 RepID=UPI0034E07943